MLLGARVSYVSNLCLRLVNRCQSPFSFCLYNVGIIFILELMGWSVICNTRQNTNARKTFFDTVGTVFFVTKSRFPLIQWNPATTPIVVHGKKMAL